MRSILHIVRKDLKMLSGRLVVWLVVLAAKTVAGIYAVSSPRAGEVSLDAINGLLLTLAVTDVALTFLLAGLLVHADEVAGSQASWMTRPIAAGRLFAAKMLAAFLALVLPAVVLAAPWWWHAGLGGAELVVASLELMVRQALVVLPVMTIASLTRSLPQLAIWSVVSMVGVLLTMAGRLGASAMLGGGYGMRMLVFGGCLLGLLVIVLPWRFARRQGNGAVLFLVGGTLLAAWGADDLAGLPQRWCSGAASQQSEPQTRGLPKVKVDWSEAREVGRGPAMRGPGTLRLEYRVEGVPTGYFLGSGRAWHHWTLPGDGLHSVRSELGSGFSRNYLAQHVALSAPLVAEQHLVASVAIGPDRVQQLREHRGGYRGVLQFELARVRLTEVPFVEGEWRRGEGRGLRILAISKSGEQSEAIKEGRREIRRRDGWTVLVLESEPASLFADLTQGRLMPQRSTGEGLRYLLRNVTGTFSETHGGQPRDGFTLNGVVVRSRTLAFNGRWVDGNAPPGGEGENTFRLGALDFGEREVLVREVRVPRFEIAQ